MSTKIKLTDAEWDIYERMQALYHATHDANTGDIRAFISAQSELDQLIVEYPAVYNMLIQHLKKFHFKH